MAGRPWPSPRAVMEERGDHRAPRSSPGSCQRWLELPSRRQPCSRTRGASPFRTSLELTREGPELLSLHAGGSRLGVDMDADIFDTLTKSMLRRRTALALLAAGAGGLAGFTPAAEARKKKRCKRKGTCKPTSQCREGTDCSTGECCCVENVFVNCPDVCRCVGNESFCCAGEPNLPPDCPSGPDVAPAFCCLKSSVCGDVCCDPGQTCVNGQCRCLPENACGTHCCDPRFQYCNQTGEATVCACLDPLSCPSGTGGFSRIRRVR